MRDWFAAFAQEQSSDDEKSWATRATRATNDEKPQTSAGSRASGAVAQAENRWATQATIPPSVAHVARVLPDGAEGLSTSKTAENREFRGVVAHVAHVAHENERSEKDSGDDWDADDWRAFYAERAAIAEHLGELSRPEAEARAFECTLIAWMNRTPAPANEPERCAHCSGATTAGDALPFLNAVGYVWLHTDCHAAWAERRRAEALAALQDMGIECDATEIAVGDNAT